MAQPDYITQHNDAELARIIKEGAIFIRPVTTTDIPNGADWAPALESQAIGFYSEDGFTLTPESGDSTDFSAHNQQVVISESAPGNWTIAFAGIEGNETITSTYFDVDVASDGSVTVTSAAASRRYDIVTAGLDQLGRMIVVHYPNVQISEREGLVFNPTTLLAYGLTFRTFMGRAAAPYHFKAWGFVAPADAPVPPEES